jgi:hypothetical protein
MDIGKYWISLSFEEVSFPTVMGSQNAYFRRKPTDSIILPVPINLVDTNRLLYKPISLTARTTEAVIGAASILGRIGGSLAGFVDRVGAVTSAGVDAASAVTGLTVNTHQTLKFEQPTLKDHNFTWKLVPSSPEESLRLKEIIDRIKANIYPRKNAYVFRYPNLVKVALFNGHQLFLFKPAYVQGFSVNYTTEGGPAFHKDEYPTSVQIDMSITENAVWTSHDFQAISVEVSDAEVGRLVSTAVTGATDAAFNAIFN